MNALIVDDNFGTALTTKISFDRNGIDSDYCLAVPEAKDMLKNKKYDYILADIIINGDDENGIHFCKYVKEKYPDSIFIFITGCNPDSVYAETAAKLSPVIFKEFSPKNIATDIIEGQYIPNDNVTKISG